MTRQDPSSENQTPARPDSASGAGRKSEKPQGNAWQINDPAPDESTADDDSRQSRTGGDYEGEAWRINEDTKD
jgi:hypothetical protein